MKYNPSDETAVGFWGECNVNELMRNAAIVTAAVRTQFDRDKTVDRYAEQFTPDTLVFNGVTYDKRTE